MIFEARPGNSGLSLSDYALNRGVSMEFISILVIIIGLAIASSANAESYVIDGKEGSKLDAVMVLAKNPGANVVRCQPVELSPKATLKVKKVAKSK
jgi:hypothetical protein